MKRIEIRSGWRFAALATAVAAALLTSGGCGPKGPARYALSGKVTYHGAPVPWGCITFLPDGTKGNSGPATLAPIVNGAYQTKAGEGTIGGPHVVLIDAFEAVTFEPWGERGRRASRPKAAFRQTSL